MQNTIKEKIMYKEEKVINGVLCVRYRPDAEFTPYTVEQLTSKVVEYESRIQYLEGVVGGMVYGNI